MSEISIRPVWYPPQFPEQGRLPSQMAQVSDNYRKQDSQEREYRNALCEAAGRRIASPCCKTLYISLFFDCNGNNLNHNFYIRA